MARWMARAVAAGLALRVGLIVTVGLWLSVRPAWGGQPWEMSREAVSCESIRMAGGSYNISKISFPIAGGFENRTVWSLPQWTTNESYIVCDFIYPIETLWGSNDFTLDLTFATQDTNTAKRIGFSVEAFVILPTGKYASYPVGTGNYYTNTVLLTGSNEGDQHITIGDIVPVRKVLAAQGDCNAATCGGYRGTLYIHRLPSGDVTNDSSQPVLLSHVRFVEEPS